MPKISGKIEHAFLLKREYAYELVVVHHDEAVGGDGKTRAAASCRLEPIQRTNANQITSQHMQVRGRSDSQHEPGLKQQQGPV